MGLFGNNKKKTDERLQQAIAKFKQSQMAQDPLGAVNDISNAFNPQKEMQPKNTGTDMTYQPDAVSMENNKKKMQFLEQLINQAPTYSAQAPYIQEYYNLIEDLYPGRSQRMGELNSVGDTGGVNSMVGMNEDYLMNQLNSQRFLDEFSAPTGNNDLDQRNAELLSSVMANPSIATQYYGNDYNPNLIDKVTGRIESILPGKKKTYDNIMTEKRLSDAGLPYQAQYSGR